VKTLKETKLEVSAKPIKENESLNTDLNSLLENGLYADFTLLVGGKEFQLHKAILASRSPYFKTMLESDFEESRKNRLEIDDVELELFEEFLRYVYTDTVDEMDENASDLLILADKVCFSN